MEPTSKRGATERQIRSLKFEHARTIFRFDTIQNRVVVDKPNEAFPLGAFDFKITELTPDNTWLVWMEMITTVDLNNLKTTPDYYPSEIMDYMDRTTELIEKYKSLYDSEDDDELSEILEMAMKSHKIGKNRTSELFRRNLIRTGIARGRWLCIGLLTTTTFVPYIPDFQQWFDVYWEVPNRKPVVAIADTFKIRSHHGGNVLFVKALITPETSPQHWYMKMRGDDNMQELYSFDFGYGITYEKVHRSGFGTLAFEKFKEEEYDINDDNYMHLDAHKSDSYTYAYSVGTEFEPSMIYMHQDEDNVAGSVFEDTNVVGYGVPKIFDSDEVYWRTSDIATITAGHCWILHLLKPSANTRELPVFQYTMNNSILAVRFRNMDIDFISGETSFTLQPKLKKFADVILNVKTSQYLSRTDMSLLLKLLKNIPRQIKTNYSCVTCHQETPVYFIKNTNVRVCSIECASKIKEVFL